jgi:hypothetical protein
MARVVLHFSNHGLVTGKSSWMTMLGRMGVHAVMDKIMSVELLSWHAKWESRTIFRSTYAVLGCRPNLALLSITCRRKSHQTNILFCSKAKFQRFRDWNHCIRTTLCQYVSQCLLADIRNHNLFFSSFMVFYWVCNKSNMTDVDDNLTLHMSNGILFYSPIWWWLRYGMGCASHDFKMNLMTLRGQFNDQSYQRDIPMAVMNVVS